MPVRLDQVPAPSPRPARPRGWLWLGVLPLLLLLAGVFGAFLFGTQSLREQPVNFWGLALGAPLLGWCLLSFGRVLLYFGQHQVADGWDQAREEDFSQKVRRGRRVQQVLGVSLHTAPQEPDAPIQLSNLLGEFQALKAQPSRTDQIVSRHSRMTCDADESSEQALRRVLTQLLADLTPILKQAPDDMPLALLLEVDSSLPEDVWQQIWQQVWSDSGIRQSTVSVGGSGLAALDQWLDQRIGDQASFMVVAFQFAPQELEGTTEVAVGLLFGNRLTQAALPSFAYLHRPEQESELTADALLYAARQALNWVPLEAQAIEQTWQVGIHAQRNEVLTNTLTAVSLPAKHNQGFYNLDTLLGNPGKASPWLAIAAAAQSIQSGAGPQFIVSGGGCVDAGLWSTVLTPVPSLSK